MPQITMKDVAKKAGVAQQTVSAILRDKNYKVTQATRERVMQIVEQMEYHPNYLASSLRKGKRMCIGVAVAGSMEDMVALSPTIYCAGVGSVLEQHGYTMELIPMGMNFESRIGAIIRAKTVDGLVIAVYSNMYEKFIQKTQLLLSQYDFPYVVIHETDRDLKCHAVGIDSRRAGYLAARYLLSTGKQRLGIVINHNIISHTHAYEGYIKALNEQGAVIAEPVILPDKTPDAGYRAGKDAIAGDLNDGYIILSDTVASGFLRALRQGGIRIPEDTAVIGGENSLDDQQYYSPLTVIDRKFKVRGKKAAEFLMQVMDNNIEGDNCLTYLAVPELVRRESA